MWAAPRDPRRLAWLVVLAGALALASVVSSLRAGEDERRGSAAGQDGSSGCLGCHASIEAMHPEANLTCTDCHGGDASATDRGRAHVQAPPVRREDERVEPLDENLAWIRFHNPMDLRVVDRTCATCHGELTERLLASLHGTTAGHLSDGFYEMGLFPERGSRYSVFPVTHAPEPGGEVERLAQPPAFQDRLSPTELSTHYTDLARKECMQCHLWSQGRAVRGRVGFDGDYRGAGCAACHVAYALDGLSRSADRSAIRTEPGHPELHEMTRAPSQQTCTACHYGDASIGLHFRGLSQLPPNTPGGPEIPGTTETQLNRVFYLNDPAITPPDVHHERGMHCIDCHTLGDVMGDGKLHGQMEHAVEISCSACHGTFSEPSTLVTERGAPLEHLRREGENVILTSKVDGREHVVPQAVHVLDPDREEYNAEAAKAMTPEHADLECYTCHAAWNVNLLGFHFSRQEQLTQLDLLSGKRTPGRVTTQEKVFATWKSFYAGRNERGAVAPYLTGFSTMGSVWNKAGELILDQVMPVTARGLSGMSMIHHQPHATRPTARACVECHRTSSTWGLGSANFRLARQLAFVADRRGVEIVAIDRAELAASAALCKLVLPDVVDLAAHCDPLQGHAHHLYAAEGGRGIHVIDVADPTRPRSVAFVACVNPRALELSGDVLFVADGIGGIKIFDVSTPEEIRLIGKLPTFDAHDVEVSWPWAYVADGPGGLVLLDVRAPIAPRVLSAVDVNGDRSRANEAILVESLVPYGRPRAQDGKPLDQRTRARNLCALLDRRLGLVLVDVTEPELPERLYPALTEQTRAAEGDNVHRGLVLLSQIDPAETQGGERTSERDYAYVLSERGPPGNKRSTAFLYDVSDPTRVPGRLNRVQAGYATEQLVAADYYSPPFRKRILFSPGELGLFLSDVSTSREPAQAGVLTGIGACYAVAIEEFPLDRMVDEVGAPLKDVSHEGSRWLLRSEFERILSVGKEELGTDLLYRAPLEVPGATVRLHFATLDADRSGWIEGDELGSGDGASTDLDGDGLISLLELARSAGLLGLDESDMADRPEPSPSGRVLEDGDLARLLDGVDPFAHDRDRNRLLDRKETELAFFDALDLDGDEKLTSDELSRHPGETRLIRFGDARARAIFERLDKNRDQRIGQREYALQDAEWEALDSDHDDRLRLLPGEHEYQRERGFVVRGSEWPSRRGEMLPLPPGIKAEKLLALFDEDADEELDLRELKARPELLLLLDADQDKTASRGEIERLTARVAGLGVDLLPDDFAGRWDLDASGTIEPTELPEGVRLRLARHVKTR